MLPTASPARSRRLLVRSAILAVALTIVAGCAVPGIPKDGGPSRVAYLAQADAICAKADTAFVEAGFDPRVVPPVPNQVAWRQALLNLRASYLTVRDLDPPDGEALPVQQFLDQSIAWIDHLVAAARANDRGDLLEVNLSVAEAVAVRDKAITSGKAYGFKACRP